MGTPRSALGLQTPMPTVKWELCLQHALGLGPLPIWKCVYPCSPHYQGSWDSKKHMMTKPEWWADEGSLRLGPRAVRLPFHLPQHSHITGGILIKSWGVRRGLVASYVNAGINGGVKPAPQRQRERDSTAWHRKINQCMKPSQGKQQLLKVIFQ